MSIPPVRRRNMLSFEPNCNKESLLSSPKSLNHWHDRTISSLNTAVQLISLVSSFLTPIPLAKEVLGSVAGILEIIKVTYGNQGDFQEVAEQCQIIGLTIWHATSGTLEHRVDDMVQRALSTLQSSVNNIRNAIGQKAKSNIVSRVFHSTLNKETIVKWKADLDRCLASFNADLNISLNAKLDELLHSFQEFRFTLVSNLQSSNDSVSNELPPRPLAFFGRDNIVQDTVKHLTRCQKVALIGPGGIGKSSIARAVLNEEPLVAKFRQQRFFVRFDNMDTSQVTLATFLDRIARMLGYNASINTYNAISRTLSTSTTLLVLDNAETFLNAPVDGGIIADAIDEFGARPNVAILLTTRTTVLPLNLNWIRTRVPSLDVGDACGAFKMFYSPPIETSTLVKLLTAIDFHPLSINLLAQVAVQNEWTPEELIVQWNNQRVSLLEVGSGKIQSLGVTIEISLSSPSIRKFGDIICHFLQIIAFLPQGVNTTHLSDIFWSQLSQIESCKDALCRQSLAYLAGDFITLLEPIRLYIMRKTPIDENIFFQEVLSYYTRYHSTYHVRQEHVNMDHIFTYCLSSQTATIQVLQSLNIFIRHLWQIKPRPLPAIRRALSSLDVDNLMPSSNSWTSTVTVRVSHCNRNRKEIAVIAKARCLLSMSLLMRWIGQASEAEELLAINRKQFRIYFHRRLAQQLINDFDEDVARIHYSMGNYQAAEELFQSLLQRIIPKCKHKDPALGADIAIDICRVQMIRGKYGMSKEILEYLPLYQKFCSSSVVWEYAGEAELHDGHLDLAKQYFQKAKELCNVENDSSYTYIRSLALLGEVAYLGGDKIEFRKFCEQGLSIASDAQDKSKWPRLGFMTWIDTETDFFAILSGSLAMEGSIDQAQEILDPYLSPNSNQDRHRSHPAVVTCLYVAGCIALHAEDFDKAEEHFQHAIETCLAIQEFCFRILSERALGEISVKRQDMVTAKAHFDVTSKSCEITGMPKNKLYYEFSCFKLTEVYDGWKRYQQDRTIFNL